MLLGAGGKEEELTIYTPIYKGLATTDKALEGGYLTEKDIEMLDDPEFSRTGSVLRLPEKNAMVNLYCLSLTMIHFPLTESYPNVSALTLKIILC